MLLITSKAPLCGTKKPTQWDSILNVRAALYKNAANLGIDPASILGYWPFWELHGIAHSLCGIAGDFDSNFTWLEDSIYQTSGTPIYSTKAIDTSGPLSFLLDVDIKVFDGSAGTTYSVLGLGDGGAREKRIYQAGSGKVGVFIDWHGGDPNVTANEDFRGLNGTMGMAWNNAYDIRIYKEGVSLATSGDLVGTEDNSVAPVYIDVHTADRIDYRSILICRTMLSPDVFARFEETPYALLQPVHSVLYFDAGAGSIVKNISTIQVISQVEDVEFLFAGTQALIEVKSSVEEITFYNWYIPQINIESVSLTEDSIFKAVLISCSSNIPVFSSAVDSALDVVKLNPIAVTNVVSSNKAVEFKTGIGLVNTEVEIFHSEIDYLRDDLLDSAYALTSTATSFKLYSIQDLNILSLELVIQAKASASEFLYFDILDSSNSVVQTGSFSLSSVAQTFSVILNKNKLTSSVFVQVRLTATTTADLYSLRIDCTKIRCLLRDEFSLTSKVLFEYKNEEGYAPDVNSVLLTTEQETSYLRAVDQVWDISGELRIHNNFNLYDYNKTLQTHNTVYNSDRRLINIPGTLEPFNACFKYDWQIQTITSNCVIFGFTFTGWFMCTSSRFINNALLYHYHKNPSDTLWLSGTEHDITWGYDNSVFLPLEVAESRLGEIHCDKLNQETTLEEGFLQLVTDQGAEPVLSKRTRKVEGAYQLYVDRLAYASEFLRLVDSKPTDSSIIAASQGVHIKNEISSSSTYWADLFTASVLRAIPPAEISSSNYLLGKV